MIRNADPKYKDSLSREGALVITFNHNKLPQVESENLACILLCFGFLACVVASIFTVMNLSGVMESLRYNNQVGGSELTNVLQWGVIAIVGAYSMTIGETYYQPKGG